jgi:hypothetical protein
MAPGLEEELVFQVMKESRDRQYLSDRINALRSLDFKIDDKKVENAVKRYELLQKHNPKESSLKSRIQRILIEKRESIKEEAETLSLKIKIEKVWIPTGGGRYFIDCKECDNYLYRAYANITYLKELENGEVIKQKSRRDLFYFCKSCELISDQKLVEHNGKMSLIHPR